MSGLHPGWWNIKTIKFTLHTIPETKHICWYVEKCMNNNAFWQHQQINSTGFPMCSASRIAAAKCRRYALLLGWSFTWNSFYLVAGPGCSCPEWSIWGDNLWGSTRGGIGWVSLEQKHNGKHDKKYTHIHKAYDLLGMKSKKTKQKSC